MAGKLNLDPQSIVDKEFDIDFKGYNPDQVDRMLDLVIQDYQTYQNLLEEMDRKLADMEKTNASLRAKLIEVEGKQRAQADDPIGTNGSSQVDLLKRISRLEAAVFNK